MQKILLVLFPLFLSPAVGRSQTPIDVEPEFKISYYGHYVGRSGASIGVAFPFSSKLKEKEKAHRKKGTYVLTKQRILKWGGNLSFYHHPKDHNGYLINTELTFHRIKNRPFKEGSFKHLEMAVGLGYFRYQLLGTTFLAEDGSFKEINGNGSAFMPSLSLAWGKNIRAVKNMDMRYFFKPSILFEIPYNAGFKTNFAFEIGLISKINFKTSKKSNQ